MKPVRVAVWPCAVLLLAVGTSPSQAAWHNVFQVCCHNCGSSPPAASYYAPEPCPAPCPPPCTTTLQARCYYEPVTSYQTKTYYEPVTTYKTSYYYEPVTSYRTSCYYDPCTCRSIQVSTPTVSYQLKSQCCPVQSWVQRCASVPVTTYRQAFYYEPVTTCCAPPPCPPPCPPAATGGAPGVNERKGNGGVPGVNEFRDGGASFRSQSSPLQAQPVDPSYRQPVLQNPAAQPASPPVVKFDGIVALPPANVEGQVVRASNQPQAGADVVFVSIDRQGTEEKVTSSTGGQFRANLAAGGWRVYMSGPDGKLAYQRSIEVASQPVRFTLVSR